MPKASASPRLISTAFAIEVAWRERLIALAETEGVNVSELLRQIVKAGVQQREEQHCASHTPSENARGPEKAHPAA